MKIEKLKRWNEFEDAALTLIRDTETRSQNGEFMSKAIFRGQGSATWDLCTTLDRNPGIGERTMSAYHSRISAMLPSVQASYGVFTDLSRTINVESFQSFVGSEKSIRILEYMAYLRHYRFPSPLLDWSTSPYIASFFAYRDDRLRDEIAIYAFQEYQTGTKGWWTGRPHIRGVGPNIRCDRMHIVQQRQYTVCLKEEDGVYSYASHQAAFEESKEGQDSLTKFVLPASERMGVLRKLDLMNVNAMSLFHNEEGLMETLSIR